MKRDRCRVITCILLLLLTGSLVANYLVYRQAREYYIEMNAIRLDPLGLSHYSSTNGNQDMEKVVVFYGDSRAYDWPAPDIDGLTFLNRGIQGETSAQAALRFDFHIKPLNPGIVVLQVGINDLTDVGFMPQDYEKIVENCKANIEQIINRALAMNSAVVVTTIFPAGEAPLYRQMFWSDEVMVAVKDVNVFIRGLSVEGVNVFDSYAILVGDEGKIKPEYSRDTLHLNEAGYEKLNEEIIEFLAEID